MKNRSIQKIILTLILTFTAKLYAEESTPQEVQPVIAPEDVRVIFAAAPVNCDSNLALKVGSECELIISFNPENKEVFLVKLYKRGTTENDLNHMSKNPVSYKSIELPIEFISKVKLTGSEEVNNISARFKRNKDAKTQLVLNIRVEIVSYRSLTTAERDAINSANTPDDENTGEELTHTKTGQRELNLEFPIKDLSI